MAILSNPQLVETPPAGPLRYGLFRAARVTDDLGPREVAAGFTFAAEGCGTGYLFDANCDAPEPKTFDEGLSYVEGSPYWLYATQQCGTVGRAPAEVTRSVTRKLAGAEQTLVEGVLWSGNGFASAPALTTNAGTVTVVPTAPGAGAAIAALEASFYAEYGYVGTIHVNTAAVGALAYSELITEAQTAGVKTTPLGSLWSIGAGYGTDGPAEEPADAGFVWAFMTPPVWIRRQAQMIVPDVTMTMNRVANQYMAIAERVYAHAWECPVVHAVQVPLAAPAVEAVPAVP